MCDKEQTGWDGDSLAEIAKAAGMPPKTFINELAIHMVRLAKMQKKEGENGIRLELNTDKERWVLGVMQLEGTEDINEG